MLLLHLQGAFYQGLGGGGHQVHARGRTCVSDIQQRFFQHLGQWYSAHLFLFFEQQYVFLSSNVPVVFRNVFVSFLRCTSGI